MIDLYSFVDVGDEAKRTILRLEGVITRIALQATECGIFILHHTSDIGTARSFICRDDLLSV
jgi:hypothetical protein